jgi:hypothetical protein
VGDGCGDPDSDRAVRLSQLIVNGTCRSAVRAEAPQPAPSLGIVAVGAQVVAPVHATPPLPKPSPVSASGGTATRRAGIGLLRRHAAAGDRGDVAGAAVVDATPAPNLSFARSGRAVRAASPAPD